MGTPGKAPSGMFLVLPGGAPAFFPPLLVEAGSAFFPPLLVEAGLAPAAGLVFGAVGGFDFGFFGAGSRSDSHAAGRLSTAASLSFLIRPAAKSAGEVAAGGIEASGSGADCSGMVPDGSEMGANSCLCC